uniref:Uncharacterized protein n=1 Tax=Oryza meridionalis TaxID=40149 RepID=A0A0E0E775_9ORYZ
MTGGKAQQQRQQWLEKRGLPLCTFSCSFAYIMHESKKSTYIIHQAYRYSPTISHKDLGILIFLLDPKSHEQVCICVLYLTMSGSLKLE